MNIIPKKATSPDFDIVMPDGRKKSQLKKKRNFLPILLMLNKTCDAVEFETLTGAKRLVDCSSLDFASSDDKQRSK